MTLYDSGAITYGKGLLGYYSFCQQSRPWTSQPVVVFAVVGVLMYSGGVQTYFASGCLLYGCTLYAARLEWRTVCSPDTTPPHHHTTAGWLTAVYFATAASTTPLQQHQHQQERSRHYITLPCPMFPVSKHLTKEMETRTSNNGFF